MCLDELPSLEEMIDEQPWYICLLALALVAMLALYDWCAARWQRKGRKAKDGIE